MPILNPPPPPLASDPALSADWTAFGTWLERIEADLDTLPRNFSFLVRGENTDRFVGAVPVADLKRKFAAISWTLVGDDFQNGGVGEVRSTWKKGLFKKKWMSADQRTNATSFRGYAAQPAESGLVYLALHETAHVTDLGLDTGNQCWNMFRQSGRPEAEYPQTDHWRYNEAVANSVTRSVCERLSYPVMAGPGAGYVQ